MNACLLELLQLEVAHQCEFALMAAEDLDRALKSGDSRRVWFSVQAFLVAVGNVSKLLWPSRPQIPDRGDVLRASLSVEFDSPLEPRRLRNHFEHFDERLEKWALAHADGPFVDSNIFNVDARRAVGFGEELCLRYFNSTTWTVTFRGDEYVIPPVLPVIQALHVRASREASRRNQGSENSAAGGASVTG